MAGLEDAILLAVEAHRGQRDRVGQPYILHPLRVMCRLQGEAERTAGVLHDVVEDTAYTLDDLRTRGYPEEVVAAVDCLSGRPGETYLAYIDRIKPNPLACRVKLADLEDNMDLRRISSGSDLEVERYGRYVAAWHALRALEE